jgi:competence protein ComEA
LVKGAAAAGVALILAAIGVKAGAHGPPPPFEPASSATPLATANLLGLPAALTADDAGLAVKGAPGSLASPGHLGTADHAESPLAPTAENASPGEAVLPDGRVVLNLASEAELTKLPGIGPSRARAILALRQRLTKFRAVEDLLRIKGIGRKMLRRLRPSVVLDRPVVDPGTAPAAPARHATPTEAPEGA